MMKIKIFSKIVLAVMVLANVGCNDWLDVTPQAQVNAEKLFSNPKGYESVVYGIYTSMTRASMYGEHMTYGLMDVMAQYYKANTNSAHKFYEATRYNYENGDVKDAIKGIWLDSYNSIANCNILLEYLEPKSPDFFDKDHYNLIKGEALALRAYLHFDLLRAFAPSWKDNAKGMSIPYADRFTNKIHRQLTTTDVIGHILADLDSARNLLKGVDPVFYDTFKDPIYHYGQPLESVAGFKDFRAYRMNYYAVTGLMARVYNYMGDVKAYQYAREVIDARKEGCFRFATEAEVSAADANKDVVMQNEILFALNYPDVHKLFYAADALGSTGYDLKKVDKLFPLTDDLRKKLVRQNSRKQDISLKFADIKSTKGGKIPMIRLSEMYLIAAERGFSVNKDEATGYLEELRRVRGVPADLKGISFSQLLEELTVDARREFVSEGQMFYWYKRLGLSINDGETVVTPTKKQFSLPMPATEIEFGGRVEEYLK